MKLRLAKPRYPSGRQLLKKDHQMSTRMLVAMVAALSLSAVTVASAAHSPSSSMMSTSTSDTLTLSSAQRKTAWDDLSKGAPKQILPSGYSATAGSVVPS